MKLTKFRSLAIAALLLLLLTFGLSTPALAENSADLDLFLSTNRCIQCDLSSTDFSGKNLSHNNLSSTDLSHANLSGADLSNTNLSKADLTHANLQSTQLGKANLKNSNLSDADLSQANLNSANLSDAYLVNANFSGANLTAARFIGFFGGAANLKSVNFSAADLHGAILRNTNLVNANLSRANLSQGTDLQGAKLDGSDLNSADLSSANLRDASLTHVSLQNANLSSADLSHANLTGSDLSGVDFTDIKLSDAILDKTIGLDPYADGLLQKAKNQAASENFPTAINYLKEIPAETKAYPEAQIKIAQYTELQKEAEAKQLLEKAENFAASDNFDSAIYSLKKVPPDTKEYSIAQEKITQYAKVLLEKAENAADSGDFDPAIHSLKKVPSDTKEYSTAQEKIAEYTAEKQSSIGVKRSAIQSIFEQPEFDFTFTPETPIDGKPNIVGRKGNTVIQLVSPPNNLKYATVIVTLDSNPENSLVSVAHQYKFLKATSPNWMNSLEWLDSSFTDLNRNMQSEASTTYGNQQITFAIARELGSIFLTVEAKKQR